jgi:hypothetical protein
MQPAITEKRPSTRQAVTKKRRDTMPTSRTVTTCTLHTMRKRRLKITPPSTSLSKVSKVSKCPSTMYKGGARRRPQPLFAPYRRAKPNSTRLPLNTCRNTEVSATNSMSKDELADIDPNQFLIYKGKL